MASSQVLGEMIIKVKADMAQVKKDMGDMRSQFTKTSDTSKAMSTTAKIAFAAIGTAALLAAKHVIKMATDAAETRQKFEVVFTGISKEADLMAQNFAASFGVSKKSAEDMLATTANVLQSVGYTTEASLEMANSVNKLAGDLVSFSNYQGGAAQAADILTKAMLGEREALGSLGFKIMEAELKSYIEAEGKSYESATQAEKAQATLAIAYQKNANAIGDYARSFDSVANLSRAVGARFDDISVAVGKELLPSLSQLGMAFLAATKDGGPLLDMFVGLSKGAATVIRGYAILIELMNKASNAGKLSASEEDMKKARDILATYKQRLIETGAAFEGTKVKWNNMWNSAATPAQKNALKNYEDAQKNVTRARKGYTDNLQESMSADERLRKITEGTTEAQNAAAKATKDANARLREKRDLEKTNKGASGSGDKETAKALAEEKIKIAQDFSDKSFEIENDKMAMIDREEQAYLAKVKGNAQAETDITKVYADQRSKIRMEEFESALSFASQTTGKVAELFSQYATNQNMEIDDTKTKKLDALQEQYDADVDAVNKSTDTQENKDKKLKALDEKKAREEKAINDKADKAKRKAAYDLAVSQKATGLIQIVIDTAQAVMKTYAQAGFFGGTIPAAIIAGLGAAQFALVAAQPLPALAKGGIFDGAAIIGEDGKEAAIPLEGEAGKNAFALMADAIMGNINTRVNNQATVESVPETTQTSKGAAMYIDGTYFGQWITEATDNGQIRVNQRSVR